MSDEPVTLEFFGDPDAAQCVDGVCAVPTDVGDRHSDAGASPEDEAEVSPSAT